MSKALPWGPGPVEDDRARRVAAWALRAAGAALARLAERMQPAAGTAEEADPVLEFHAEAGAPEGALYVDGRLVGHLFGVQRL